LILIVVSFAVQSILIWCNSIFQFCSYLLINCASIQKSVTYAYLHQGVFLWFSWFSQAVIKFLVYFELVFVQGDKDLVFSLLHVNINCSQHLLKRLSSTP
jgi:hypothetical protein